MELGGSFFKLKNEEEEEPHVHVRRWSLEYNLSCNGTGSNVRLVLDHFISNVAYW